MVQVVILNEYLSIYIYIWDEITLNWWKSTKLFDDDHKCIMNPRNMKNKSSSKYLRSWSFCPKPDLAICIWASLLNGKLWRSHLSIFHLSTSHNNTYHLKIFKLNNILLLNFRHLTKSTMVLRHQNLPSRNTICAFKQWHFLQILFGFNITRVHLLPLLMINL